MKKKLFFKKYYASRCLGRYFFDEIYLGEKLCTDFSFV